MYSDIKLEYYTLNGFLSVEMSIFIFRLNCNLAVQVKL